MNRFNESLGVMMCVAALLATVFLPLAAATAAPARADRCWGP